MGVSLGQVEAMLNQAQVQLGFKALELLVRDLVLLGKDAVLFIIEKELWNDFMAFHTHKCIERAKES